MFITRRVLGSLLTVVLGCASFGALAEESVDSQTGKRTLSYAILYEDAEGVSHYKDDELELALEDYSPPADPIAVHAIKNADTATLVLLPTGAFEDWHPAPRRQFAFILGGTVEVTAGDGEARHFGPGTVVFLDDTKGTGHQTRVISEDDSLTLMVAVDED